MCPGTIGMDASSRSPSPKVPPPDVESLVLPPKHVLAHLTDAHCHPTDLNPTDADFRSVPIGGVAAMATNNDQEAVSALASERGWPEADDGMLSLPGPKVVACFGYHPWFVHRFSLGPPPSKHEHYRAVFAPKAGQEDLLEGLLKYLPDPEDFGPHLEAMRANLVKAKAAGRLALVGEIGLDATSRVRIHKSETDAFLSPFKTTMAHQLCLARAQLELAAELSLPVSWHCVAASGSTLDLFRDTYPQLKVDIHSLGGMAPEFLRTMAKCCPNAYFSPSLLITARGGAGTDAVRALPRERVLVESDTHDLSRCTSLVWGAVLWIAECRGWQVEDGSEPWEMEEEDEFFDDKGRIREPRPNEIWAVRTLERNWARFMGIIDY